MNEPQKFNTIRAVLAENTCRFYLALVVVSVAIFVAVFVADNTISTPAAAWLRRLAAFTVAGAVLAFLVGMLGFIAILTPPLQPLARWVARRSVFLLACFITLVALFYAQENWRGKSAWDEFKRETRARGEPLEVAEIVPPTVPDDQNVATAPLFRPLSNEFDPEWRRQHTGRSGLTNAEDRVKFTIFYAGDSGPTNKPFASWAEGRRTALKAWQDYYRNPPAPEAAAAEAFVKRYGIPPAGGSANREVVEAFPTAPQAQTPAADVLLALGKHDAILEELRIAAARPESRFPIRYEDGFSALLPHLARMKPMQQYLALRVAAELEAGQVERAAENAKLGLRVVDVARSEPLLISQLVRIAQFQIALNSLWEGLATHRWTEAHLTDFERQLGGFDFLADFRRGMLGERALSTWTVDFVRRERQMDLLDSATPPPVQNPLFGAVIGYLLPSGLFDQNKASIGRMHRDWILPAVDVAGHRVDPGHIKELQGSVARGVMTRSPYNFFAALLIPALGNSSQRFARAQVAVDLARVACALERHRLALGQYPESLEALAPRFITKVPHDVINGQPLKYRRGDDSIVIYSVGWNETDDGGKIVLSRNDEPSYFSEGDWVWQFPVQ